MIKIEALEKDKGTLCHSLMSELSDWFDEPDANAAAALAVENMPVFIARVAGEVAGLTALKQHPPDTTEIFVIAVRERHHRSGVGRLLVEAACNHARSAGSRLLTVKTLAPRAGDPPRYAKTRAFYTGLGFFKAEVFPTLWHPDFPCLFLIKPLGNTP